VIAADSAITTARSMAAAGAAGGGMAEGRALIAAARSLDRQKVTRRAAEASQPRALYRSSFNMARMRL